MNLMFHEVQSLREIFREIYSYAYATRFEAQIPFPRTKLFRNSDLSLQVFSLHFNLGYKIHYVTEENEEMSEVRLTKDGKLICYDIPFQGQFVIKSKIPYDTEEEEREILMFATFDLVREYLDEVLDILITMNHT